jgi:sugar lactone lactonase YvrE
MDLRLPGQFVVPYSVWMLAICLGLGSLPAPMQAQTVHFGWSQRTIGGGYGSNAVAVDASGNIYVAGFDDGSISELTAVGGVVPGTPVITKLATGFTHPNGLAVDKNGNVYVADAGNAYSGGPVPGSVQEIVAVGGAIPPSPTIRVLANGLSTAISVAVDGQGDVFFADRDASLVKEIVAAGGAIRTLGSGFTNPFGVAVDGSGNIYVADGGNSQVKEIVASGGSIPVSNPTILILGSGFDSPTGVAVDSSGNVFVSDIGLHEVREIVAENGTIPNDPTIQTLGSGFSLPYGIAVDRNDDVFVADMNDSVVSLGGVNFGTLGVGSTSVSLTLTFVIDHAISLNGTMPYRVTTQGAQALDFVASATQETDVCSAKSYVPPATCTVAVTFTPTLPGSRYGAVTVVDASGNTATGYLNGTGTAPQVSFGWTPPVVVETQDNGVPSAPIGLATDGNRNVYVVDSNNRHILKETLSGGSYTQSILPTRALTGPRGAAIDGAGNVYVMDTFGDIALKETLKADGTYVESVVKQGGFYYAYGIAVDVDGNVYIANAGAAGAQDGYVLKEALQSNGSYVETRILQNLESPYGLAVDASGSVYLGESNNPGSDRVLKETPTGGGYTESVVASGLNISNGVAVDGIGNVFVADTGASAVYKEALQADGTYIQSTVLNTGLLDPFGLTVDGYGSVYISDTNHDRVIRVDVAGPPSLSFDDTVVGATSAQQKTVALENIGNSALTISLLSLLAPDGTASLDFTPGTTQPGAPSCYALPASELPGNQTCMISLLFSPQMTGVRTGSLVFTDNDMNAPPTSPVSQTVPLSGTGLIAPTTTTLDISTDATIAFGTSVTLTASVMPNAVGAPAATGTVTFQDNGTVLATKPIQNGAAELTVPAFAVGSHSLMSSYSGDTNFESSVSPTRALTVTLIPTTALLTSSDSLSTYGQAITLTASIAQTSATGTFQFYDVTTGVKVPLGGPIPLGGGAASYVISTLGTGEHVFTAQYSGDATHAPISSDVLVQNVAQATLTVSATSVIRNYGQENPAYSYTFSGFVNGDGVGAISGIPGLYSRATTFSNAGDYPIRVVQNTLAAANYQFAFVNGTLTVAQVTPGQDGVAAVTIFSSQNPSFWGTPVQFTAILPANATGIVEFYDGPTLLGTATVIQSLAQLRASSLAVGTHPETAVYLGDVNYKGATSTVLDQVVNKSAVVVSVSASVETTVSGEPVVLTATVGADATGTVTFYDGAVVLGTATVSGGTAVLTTSALAVGTHTITVSYGGDANYLAGSSLPVTVVVNPAPDFAVASSTGPQEIPPGSTASYTIAVSSVNLPFTNRVTLTATGLPPGATYSFSPPTVIPGADGAVSTLSISVPLQTASFEHHYKAPLMLAIVLLPLAMLRKTRVRLPQLLLWIMLTLTALGAVSGCGAGGYFSQSQQTYIITVTGTSGSLVHSTSVTLTVE